MLHQEKPALDENLLEHHGVRGMKWGVRRNGRPTADAIRGARTSVAAQKRKVEVAANKIHKTKEGTAARKVAVKTHADLRVAHLNNPDRATAMRMTRGEKAILGLLGVTGIGIVPAAGLGAAQYTYRKTIEGRQASGYYKYGYHKNR